MLTFNKLGHKPTTKTSAWLFYIFCIPFLPTGPVRHFPLQSPLNFNTLLSAKEVRKASVMSHDGQEHMAPCALNHGQEHTTDHSVQWTMMARNTADCNVQWAMMARNAWHRVHWTMVRNIPQITVCNEPWWWGTHRRSQYAMNHDGQEHIADRNVQWTMVLRNTSQITMCNEPWSGTYGKSMCNEPWLQCTFGQQYQLQCRSCQRNQL